MVVTMEGNHILVSLKDQKLLLLIEQMYHKFWGRGKDSRRKSARNSKNPKASDSGVDSASNTNEDGNTTNSENEKTTEVSSKKG